VFGLFGSKRNTKAPAAPDGAVVWAVGDIHGRYDLGSALVNWMLGDLRRSEPSRAVLVFLGDYVDRGPQSRDVLDLLWALKEMPGIETHFLRGNHEERLEAVLGAPELAVSWCDYGGVETLQSYGASPPALRDDVDGWAAAVDVLNRNMPDRHRRFLEQQELSFTLGDYFFAHAGARPGVPLDQQDPHDLMWIRQEFLAHRKRFEKVVVHGHTPSKAVEADARRINLDTGAYVTGVLTALRLEGDQRRFAQTSVRGGVVSVTEFSL
jgi:serine/threonine protein phosphatase 1